MWDLAFRPGGILFKYLLEQDNLAATTPPPGAPSATPLPAAAEVAPDAAEAVGALMSGLPTVAAEAVVVPQSLVVLAGPPSKRKAGKGSQHQEEVVPEQAVMVPEQLSGKAAARKTAEHQNVKSAVGAITDNGDSGVTAAVGVDPSGWPPGKQAGFSESPHRRACIITRFLSHRGGWCGPRGLAARHTGMACKGLFLIALIDGSVTQRTTTCFHPHVCRPQIISQNALGPQRSAPRRTVASLILCCDRDPIHPFLAPSLYPVVASFLHTFHTSSSVSATLLPQLHVSSRERALLPPGTSTGSQVLLLNLFSFMASPPLPSPRPAPTQALRITFRLASTLPTTTSARWTPPSRSVMSVV